MPKATRGPLSFLCVLVALAALRGTARPEEDERSPKVATTRTAPTRVRSIQDRSLFATVQVTFKEWGWREGEPTFDHEVFANAYADLGVVPAAGDMWLEQVPRHKGNMTDVTSSLQFQAPGASTWVSSGKLVAGTRVRTHSIQGHGHSISNWHGFPRQVTLYVYYRPAGVPSASVGQVTAVNADGTDAGPTTAPPPPPADEPDPAYDILDLEARAEPDEVDPDGRSVARLLIGLSRKTIHPDGRVVRRPYANHRVDLEICEENGVRPGRLSASTVVTDGDGRARVDYRAPTPEEVQEADTSSATVRLRAQVDGSSLEELELIHFRIRRGTLLVEPHFASVVSTHGVVPADERFPATLEYRVGKPRQKVLFRIEGDPPVGEIRTLDGRGGARLEVLSDEEGWARALYAYTGGAPSLPHRVAIRVTSAATPRGERALVTVGLDPILVSARSGYDGKGTISAGEEVPLRISIDDRYHPGKRQLARVLQHWGSGGLRGDERLRLRLRVEPSAQAPAYFLDSLRLAKHPPMSFDATLGVLRDPADGKLYLWAPASSGLPYEGLPRIRLSAAGTESYRVSVTLADSKGRRVGKAEAEAPIQYLEIPVGLPADAWTIFLYEDPFAAHTPTQKVLRAIAERTGFGSAVLSITDAAQLLNQQRYEKMGEIAAEAFLDWALGKVNAEAILGEEGARLFGLLSTAESYATDIMKHAPREPALSGPIAAIRKRLIDGVLQATGLPGKRMVVMIGDGTQTLIDARTGKEIPTTGAALQTTRDGTVHVVRNGPVSVYLIPKDLDVESLHAQVCEIHGGE